MDMPNDPVMLLSFVNTKLRDEFSSLEKLADYYGKSADEICSKLETINYFYDSSTNSFK